MYIERKKVNFGHLLEIQIANEMHPNVILMLTIDSKNPNRPKKGKGCTDKSNTCKI